MKLAFLVAAATVVSMSPAVAQAGSDTAAARSVVHHVVLHDGAGDTWTWSHPTTGYQPLPPPEADVLRTRVTHGQYAVGVRMVFDDLKREHTQWYYCEIHVAGATSWYILEAAEGHWRGIMYQDVEGEWVRVPRVSHKIDYAAETVALRVPRRLLGNPAWVRVRLHNVLGLGEGVFFTDNPANAGHEQAYTPRVLQR
jgi:hypothetical protein